MCRNVFGCSENVVKVADSCEMWRKVVEYVGMLADVVEGSG